MPQLGRGWATRRPFRQYVQARQRPPFFPPGVLYTGGLINDEVRQIARDGDGRAVPDSSFGIWAGTTNEIPNGGFEVDINQWSPGNSATLARTTAESKFGGAAMAITTNTGSANQGANTDITSVNGTTYTFSVWLKGQAGVGYCLDTNGVQGPTVTGTGGWQRLVQTVVATSTSLSADILCTDSLAHTYYVDGVQIEANFLATPYVEKFFGGTAVRAAGRVQMPTTGLDETRGWVAVRVRPGWASTLGDSVGTARVWAWSDDGTHEIQVFLEGDGSGGARARVRRSAPGGLADTVVPATFAAGDTLTVVASWTATTVNLSVNGSAFTVNSTSGAAQVPVIAAAFADIGNSGGNFQVNGDILWVLTGTGTLTDAGAGLLHAQGNTDPYDDAPIGSTPTFLWPADTAAYYTPTETTIIYDTGTCTAAAVHTGTERIADTNSTASQSRGGYVGVPPSRAGGSDDTAIVAQYTLPGMRVDSVYAYLAFTSSGGSIEAFPVIYTDDGTGNPGTLVAQGFPATTLYAPGVVSDGYYEFPFASPVDLAGGTYWIGILIVGTGACNLGYDGTLTNRGANWSDASFDGAMPTAPTGVNSVTWAVQAWGPANHVINTGTGTVTTSGPTDSGTNTGTAAHTATEGIRDSTGNTATGSVPGTEAVSDTGTCTAAATHTGTDAVRDSSTSTATGSTPASEAIADTQQHTGTATPQGTEALNDTNTTTATGSTTATEATADTGTTTANGTTTGPETIADATTTQADASHTGTEGSAYTNTATATTTGAETITDSGTCTASAAPTGSEAITDTGALTATATHTGAEADSEAGTCTASGTHTATEAVADSGTCTGTGGTTGSAAGAETGTSTGTATPTGADAVADAATSTGTAAGTAAEAINDSGTSTGTGSNAADFEDLYDQGTVQATATLTGSEEVTGGDVTDSGTCAATATHTGSEAIVDSQASTAAALTTGNEAVADASSVQATGTLAASEVLAESGTSGGTAEGTGGQATNDTATSVGTAVLTANEVLQDSGTCTAAATLNGAEAIYDQGVCAAAASHTGTDAKADSGTCQATAMHTAAEALAETGDNTAMVTVPQGDQQTDQGTNTGTGVHTGGQAIADSGVQAAVSAHTGAEATADQGTGQATASATGADVVADVGTSAGTASHTGAAAPADSGTSTSNVTASGNEALAAAGTSTATATHEGSSPAFDTGTCQGTVVHTGAEALAEDGVCSTLATHTGDATAQDSGTSVATATTEGTDAVADAGTTGGAGTATGTTGVADTGTVQATATVTGIGYIGGVAFHHRPQGGVQVQRGVAVVGQARGAASPVRMLRTQADVGIVRGAGTVRRGRPTADEEQ